jgi:hypothetical protein
VIQFHRKSWQRFAKQHFANIRYKPPIALAEIVSPRSSGTSFRARGQNRSLGGEPSVVATLGGAF